jgi:hypothetical protein
MRQTRRCVVHPRDDDQEERDEDSCCDEDDEHEHDNEEGCQGHAAASPPLRLVGPEISRVVRREVTVPQM